MSSVVRVKDIEKTFVRSGFWPWSPTSSVHAVQGVNLDIKPGEVVALVGQSGSGKTTLSRMILGLEEPTAGEIYLDGMRWDGLSESKRRRHRANFQYVPQDAMGALNPQQTALEHISETYRVLGHLNGPESLDAASELLNSLGLGDRLHALPRSMSGGEQRRVTLARVLALKSKLVVADEPTSGLDPDRRELVLEALINNLPENAACILVTHDMSEARDFCHRIYAMLAGRVIEKIDLRERQPLHPYAKILFDPWSSRLPSGILAEKGCPFVGDCSLVTESLRPTCTQINPKLSTLSQSHSVACHAAAIDQSS